MYYLLIYWLTNVGHVTLEHFLQKVPSHSLQDKFKKEILKPRTATYTLVRHFRNDVYMNLAKMFDI